MAFTPRRLEDGRICCSSPTALCEKCQKHFSFHRANQAAPDPYASARSAESVDLSPSLDPRYQVRGTPPDGYLIGLALRAAQAGQDPAPLAAKWDRLNPPDPYALGIRSMREQIG